MKISKIASLCKKRKLIFLMDDEYGGVQWLGDGVAAYPLYGMPELDAETICPVLSISEKEAEHIHIQHISFPTEISTKDSDSTEICMEDRLLTINTGLGLLAAYRANESTIEFVDTKYITPLLDGQDYPEIFLRRTSSGEHYFAAKHGLMLAAVIMPTDALSKELVDKVDTFSSIAKDQLLNKNSKTIAQIPITDPDTGEIVS